ncbi:MAG: TfoX/Sxy family protein [Myxococcota bacterium]
MASRVETAEYVLARIAGAGNVRYRKMFGEFGVFCDDKMVALICDDRLYVRPTAAGRAFIGTPAEAPPYPRAKNHFLIQDQLDDAPWLAQLVHLTAAELPLPAPKKPRGRFLARSPGGR